MKLFNNLPMLSFSTVFRKIVLPVLVFFLTGSAFAQNKGNETNQHGHAGKKVTSKGSVVTDPKVAAVLKEIDERMVRVDGGTFSMGCPTMQDSDCYYWEKPRHTVVISTLFVSKYDVTQKEWKTIMGSLPPANTCDECPVINVTWHDAYIFINKLNQLSGKNYRLPTEAEWEYAAKGGNKAHGYKYAGGDVAMEVAWYDSTISKTEHPVGEKKANELGLYDMSGNVWQWCSDWFDEKYYSKSPSNNPQGPTVELQDKVVRGGSWWGPMKDCRIANRDKFGPNAKDDDVGFRLVRN
ncbi:MAG TPA: formylglycine-generating enzyme family protein [Chitinophagales bacterium]|nr:formylglycine-generating enzyme family protein [Chitinophagales bacterium]